VTCRNGDLEAFVEAFVEAITQHRHWDRAPEAVPA
jgi:catalase